MATTWRCPAARRQQWSKKGAQIWLLPSTKKGVSIPALMKKAGESGLLHLLCEGGARLAYSLVREKTVDEFLFFLAPRLLGGHNALSALDGNGWHLAKSPRLCVTECRLIGKDILIRAKPLTN
jgi:diaminohydroxyphosphoribosylaminopyrimidine deaminase/5-amino-6-(5-phosphoribosylamino)uracil reductase